MDKNGSEVARIRQQIEEELEAMQLGFSGLAAGSARHDFIRARMEQVGNCVALALPLCCASSSTQFPTCSIRARMKSGPAEPAARPLNPNCIASSSSSICWRIRATSLPFLSISCPFHQHVPQDQ